MMRLPDLGSVNQWLDKVALTAPKGSKYTKRFGQKYKNKMVYTAGKIPGQGARGPYTKIAFTNTEIAAILAPGLLSGAHELYSAPSGQKLRGLGRAGVKGLMASTGAMTGGVGSVVLGGDDERDFTSKDLALLTGGYLGGGLGGHYLGGLALDKLVPYTRPSVEPEAKVATLNNISWSFIKEAPAKSKAQAKFMAIWEKKHGHPEKAKEWFEGTSNKPEHVKKKESNLTNIRLGSFSNTQTIGSNKGHNPLVEELKKKIRDYAANVAYSFAETKGMRDIGLPQQIGSIVPKRTPANLLQGGISSFNKGALSKQAVGTGDADYESPVEGNNGNHKHVHGESECHLCKGQPIVIMERNDKSQDGGGEKEAEVHDSIEYHEILKIVAEAYGVDLATPEGLDMLPQLLREADHILAKHEKLETAEDELQEQMMDQDKHVNGP